MYGNAISADRKRKLDEVHYDYFAEAAKYQKAKAASMEKVNTLTSLQVDIATMDKKRKTEEMKQLEVEADIKVLQRRKLQLEIAEQEARLQMYVLALQSSIQAARTASQ